VLRYDLCAASPSLFPEEIANTVLDVRFDAVVVSNVLERVPIAEKKILLRDIDADGRRNAMPDQPRNDDGYYRYLSAIARKRQGEELLSLYAFLHD